MQADALVAAYRSLGRAGLIAGSGGNVSVRTPNGMLISATGTSAERIGADDVVAMPFGPRCPARQQRMGAARPAVRGPSGHRCHRAHPRRRLHGAGLSSIPSCRCSTTRSSFSGGAVRCAPYVTFGTPALADLVVTAMTDRTACLLANHGMIAAGDTLEHAVAAAFQLERLCRQYLLARSAGTPRLLTEPEIEAARARFTTYQHGQA